MSDQPINLSRTGPPETVLDAEPKETQEALVRARAEGTREAMAEVARRWPRCLEAWARLGDLGRDPIERYAYYRIGYHRGLDRLRGSGWRGSGYVRWAHAENQGFLRALAGLAELSGEIGETDEAERCETFLRQLDPAWPPAELES